MREDTVISFRQPGSFSDDPLTDIVRCGARRLLAQAESSGERFSPIARRTGITRQARVNDRRTRPNLSGRRVTRSEAHHGGAHGGAAHRVDRVVQHLRLVALGGCIERPGFSFHRFDFSLQLFHTRGAACFGGKSLSPSGLAVGLYRSLGQFRNLACQASSHFSRQVLITGWRLTITGSKSRATKERHFLLSECMRLLSLVSVLLD